MGLLINAVFMRREGVIFPRLKKGENILERRFYSYIPSAFAIMDGIDFTVVVISNSRLNEPGMSYRTFHDLTSRKLKSLCPGKIFTTTCYCKEDEDHPDKIPNIGLIKKVKSELDVDLENSVMICTIKSDIVMGQEAGIGRFILLKTRKRSWGKLSDELSCQVVNDLKEAAIYLTNGSVAD